jgi:hypothetical protein
MQTTNRTDYMGMQQPITGNYRKTHVPRLFKQRQENEDKSEYTLFYQIPRYEINELRTYGRRYSCNKYNHLPTKGITPNHTTFWYDYKKNFPRIRSAI